MNKECLPIQLDRYFLLFVSFITLCLIVSITHANTVNGYVMGIQMTPAMCLLDPEKLKKRQCLEGYSLNISGLYPETIETYCKTNSSAVLSPIQAKVVAKVMPDERARISLWHNIGGCVNMNVSQYFRHVINFADRLNIPAVMTRQDSAHIQQNMLRTMFIKLNPGLSDKSIHFQCSHFRNASYLTNIKICYHKNGQYKSCPATVTNQCPQSFIIKGSY